MKIKKLFSAVILIFSAAVFSSCSAAGDKSAKNGKELYSQGSYTEALENFSAAEENGIKSFNEAELYCYIGKCYYQLGEYEKCIDYLRKCVKTDPEFFDGWRCLGVTYKKLGDNDKAMTCYEVALNYDPGNTSESGMLYISLGSIYIERGKPISAITYLEKAKKIFQGENESATVYAYLSIAYKMALEPEKSAEAFGRAKELGYPDLDKIQEQLNKIDNTNS